MVTLKPEVKPNIYGGHLMIETVEQIINCNVGMDITPVVNNQHSFVFGEMDIRVIMIGENPWWIAKDICDVLEIENVTQAMNKLDDDERSMFNIGRQGNVNIINESGLYCLIMTSRKPEAKQFKKWITTEVLPSIRKHGAYMTPQTIEQALSDPDTIIRLATDLKMERLKRIEVETTNAILMHVNKTYTATEIAKELGFKSAQALNQNLEEKRIQYKQNDTWVLYSDYADKGLTDIKQVILDNGHVIYNARWTQLGRDFLLKLYKNQCIDAMIN